MIIGAVFRDDGEDRQAIPLFVTDEYRVCGFSDLSPKELGSVINWAYLAEFPVTLEPFMSVPGALFVDSLGFDTRDFRLSERLYICLYTGFKYHEQEAEAGIRAQMSLK